MERLYGSSLSHSPTSVAAELSAQIDLSGLSEKLSVNPVSSEPECLQPESTLQALLDKEATTYGPQCLQGLDIDDKSLVMNWLHTMTDWCYKVVDRCELPPQMVDVTLSLLHRLMARKSQRDILSDSRKFQLTIMTCLYIACKTTPTVCLTPALFQRVTQGSIRSEEIESMEMVILFALDFQIHPPTIASFAQAYAQEQLQLWNFDAVESSEQDKEQRALFLHLVEQQARLAISNLSTLSIPSSVIALACVQNALKIMDNYRMLPPMDTPLKETAYSIALLNLRAKVRKSCKQRKPEFDSQQAQLQSDMLIVALQASSELVNVN